MGRHILTILRSSNEPIAFVPRTRGTDRTKNCTDVPPVHVARERDDVGLTRRDCPGVFAGKERCAARSGATRKDRDADQRARPGNRKAAGAFWRSAASLVGHDAFSIAPLLVPRPAPKSAPSRWVKLTSSRSKLPSGRSAAVDRCLAKPHNGRETHATGATRR
jgi:hypothetical protein